jgi:mono/diheme cytochrome c family protein
MKHILIGFVAGLCVPVLGGFIFLKSGGMPVATKGPALPLERTIAKIALHAAIGSEENKTSPLQADEQNFLAGAKLYVTNCAVCHGSVNSKPTGIAQGLFPKPPQLFEPDHGVTDDPIGEIYWKVKNGIRLTGMPGYVDYLTDTEIWQISELLQNADKLPVSVQKALTTLPLEKGN